MKTAKCIFITQFFPPETGAGAKRAGAMAKALAEKHDVTVITLLPSYPSKNLFRNENIEVQDRSERYRVIRAFSFRPHDESLFKRALRELRMSIRLTSIALRMKADAILVTTPSMFLGPTGKFVASLKRSRFIWDVRDLTWRYGRQSVVAGGIQRSISRLIEAWMGFCLRRTDLIITTAAGAADVLATEHGVVRENILTLYNGVSGSFFDVFRDIPESIRARPLVMYLGLLGYNHGMDILVDVARLMPEADFLLVGDGTERTKIEGKIAEANIGNIELRGYCVDEEEVIDYYRNATILFNHSKDRAILNKAMIPAKTFEYMATGKPFAYAGKGFAADFLNSIECAEVVEPEDPEAVVGALRTMIENPHRARQMGERGRRCIEENYIREKIMDELILELRSRDLL
jgi:colanic acid biosynthesis glycosyl transferase WcaI